MRSHHTPDAGMSASRAHRWLNPAALVLVAAAAVMGWAASFVGLHAYGLREMSGFSYWSAWLVPATFDGAAFGCTLMTYRASIHGRSAVRGRVLMWAFTAVSSWINWIHQTSPEARLVAAGLPVAAVAVFEVVLLELRADYEAQHGRRAFRLRPGLLLLRWLVDRPGTTAAFRAQITRIPVHDLAALGTPPGPDEPEPATGPEPAPAPATVPEPEPEPAPAPAGPEVVRRSPLRLPPSMVEAIQRTRAQVAAEGREFTPADVQRAVKVDDTTAARIADEIAVNNGHALT